LTENDEQAAWPAIFQPLRFRSLEVKNRIFRSNIAGRLDDYDGGGGINSYNALDADGPRTIRNSTISGNNSGDLGGGIFRAGYDDPAATGDDLLKLSSTIVADNTAPTGPDLGQSGPGTAFVSGFGWACFGISIAGFAKSFENFNYVVSAVLTPLFLVAGTFFPISELPEWAQILANLNPLYQCVELVRSAAFGWEGWLDLARLGVLVAFGLVMWRIAIHAMTRKLVD